MGFSWALMRHHLSRLYLLTDHIHYNKLQTKHDKGVLEIWVEKGWEGVGSGGEGSLNRLYLHILLLNQPQLLLFKIIGE